jgi:hypothetical protein
VIAEGDTIFSYGHHFPIARWTTAPDGPPIGSRRVVLFTSRDYSNTTSGHKSRVRRAIPHGIPVFVVNDVLARTPREHAANLRGMLDAAYDTEQRIRNARSSHPWARDWFANRLAEATHYASAFGLRMPPPTLTAWLADLDAFIADMQPRWAAWDAAADARARARRVADAARWEARREEYSRSAADNFARWKAGEPIACPYSLARDVDGSALLVRRGDTVVTSLGAEFPWVDALRGWALVRAAHDSGRSWSYVDSDSNGARSTAHVGHFRIDSIDASGNVTAGCHYLSFERMREVMEGAAPSGAVPADFPVQPLRSGQAAKDRVTCGTCGLSWDDAIATTWTPAPSGRCPFEYFHEAIALEGGAV